MPFRLLRYIQFIIILMCLHISQVYANTLPPMELIVGLPQNDSQSRSTILWAGIKVDLPPGWKTYWKWSQDVGKPLSVNWENSQNVDNVEILWPTPEAINFLGYDLYGYEKQIVFPLKICINDISKPLNVNLKATILLCDASTCNEVTKDFSYVASNALLTLPKQPKNQASIQRYIEQTPVKKDLSTLNYIETYITQSRSHYTYHVVLNKKLTDNNIKAFIIPDNQIAQSGPPSVNYSSKKSEITLNFNSHDKAISADTPLQFNVSISDKNDNIEFTDVKTPPSSSISLTKIAWILLFGFIGGIILNFMPCVLPILMLKALEVINSTSQEYQNERMNYFIAAIGILFSFMAFALVTILISQLGHIATWGMHFQNPLFLFVMATLMVVFACNLWGFFEISLPTFLYISNESKGYIGHFINGMVITFLAIPCSAPFLGTAASFALSQAPMISIMIFLSIGFGFALPYFILASSSSALKRILPKPGKWMLKLKHVVGYTLIAVAVWLLWILSAMISPFAIILIASALISTMVVLYLVRYKADFLKNLTWSSLLIFTIAMGMSLHGATQNEITSKDPSFWVAFDPNKIQGYLFSKKIVFIDFTAKWCITCKFNERVVLNSADVNKALTQDHVIAMKADWTNPDPVIARFLKSYNQYAIPCYIVFSSQYPKGKVLSTILTKQEVLEHLKPNSN